jgi:cyclase
MTDQRPGGLVRIIPRLDIKGPNLVKGVNLEGLRVLGKPDRFARYYSESGADELLYMDVVASLYGRNSLLDVVERTAREIFIPLTVGGGLRSLEDIASALRAGADKIALNTAAVRNPDLIKEAAQKFGSSTIVVSIEAKRQTNGSYEAFIDHGRERTGLDAITWAIQAAELGAGEILVTAIDHEGTGSGFDVPLTREVADAVPIPVIAGGGAGQLDHILDVLSEGGADAVCMASMLHYHFARQSSTHDDYSGEGNVEYLRAGRDLQKRMRPVTIGEIKSWLAERGIACRQEEVASA